MAISVGFDDRHQSDLTADMRFEQANIAGQRLGINLDAAGHQ